MLESVLANVLTQILGQYLHGIDRNSVSFGAWSGLVELRGVALKAEALSVLFETLGMDLPVTVEAGFIGLLRVVVPWKTIGSTPVRVELEGVNIIARPVRDDGSDDSEIKLRERRIKRAKLNTDDAVREASWGVANSDGTKKVASWSWLVSEDLLAKVVANIQIELRDLILRFEDPFSNSKKPYAVAIHCDTLKAVSANESWEQVFLENVSSPRTHKLVIVEGFGVDWLPLKSADLQRYSNRGTNSQVSDESEYATHEQLQNFFSSREGHSWKPASADSATRLRSNLISPISGSLRLSLTRAPHDVPEESEQDSTIRADAQIDIRFPDISISLDDVQYASLIQTSLHFSKLSIRGYTPKTPKERWTWAVEQLLPGFRDRRARVLSFTEEGILAKRDERDLYIASRMTVLKARRSNVTVPDASAMTKDMEAMEDDMAFERIVIYRDIVDEEFEKDWALASASAPSTPAAGTTMSYIWSKLGYETAENATATESSNQSKEAEPPVKSLHCREASQISQMNDFTRKKLARNPSAQVSFHLHRGSICLSEGGFPGARTPRVDLVLKDLIIGAKRYQGNGFLIELLLGTVEAWDVKDDVRMVYARVPRSSSGSLSGPVADADSSYPVGVADAIGAIRSGFETLNLADVGEEGGTLSSEELTELDVAETVETPELLSEMNEIYKPAYINRRKNDFATWASQATELSTQATHRVTEAEFFGMGREEQTVCLPYIAALQIYRKPVEQLVDAKKRNQTQIVAAVGQLEAVVDGPKGSFLWALRFWNPKGLRKDPIMAFLGAAAGARIAELRMELEEALLADRLPLQVDALVRAPRFIIPGEIPARPAVVVNMGTLGLRTSENDEGSEQSSAQKSVGNYSNYALSLDDLGMYLAPSEKLATSFTRSLPREGATNSATLNEHIDEFVDPVTDAKSIERIIRPLSMRFFVQVLRDASTVQVVTGLSNPVADASGRISKLRLRGQIPGLWVVLSQRSCKHLIRSAAQWSSATTTPSAAVDISEIVESAGQLGTEELRDATHAHPPRATLTSYNCRIGIDNVSFELRDLQGRRLITAVASGMYATMVKTKMFCLETEFSLRSWTVTDGSRGSTAPFRRLAYAGTGSDLRGVSPPRSSSSSRGSQSRDRSESSASETNFVSIKHKFYFPGREQTIDIHFLSLNLIFVRETVIKLTSFLEGMRKSTAPGPGSSPHVLKEAVSVETENVSLKPHKDNTDEAGNVGMHASCSNISGGAIFDGFRIQFVSGEGAICSIEMRDFALRSTRDASGDLRATGDVRYFAVDDLTASIREHQSLIRYERPNYAVKRLLSSAEKEEGRSSEGGTASRSLSSTDDDGWELEVLNSTSSDILFRSRLQGLQMRYLARFTCVMSHYFSALSDQLRKSKFAADLEASSLLEQNQVQASALLAKQSKSLRFEIDARNVTVTLPRHSGNADEALIFSMPSIHVDNTDLQAAGYKSRVRVLLSEFQASVQYRVPGGERGSFLYDTAFLSKSAAELELDIRDFSEYRQLIADGDNSRSVTAPFMRAQFTVADSISMQLCEAQYTVLYFVLTENFAETIDAEALLLDSDDAAVSPEQTPGARAGTISTDSTEPPSMAQDIAPFSGDDESENQRKAPIVRLTFQFPNCSIVVSRGWNVLDQECRIAELKVRDVLGDIVYSDSELGVELHSTIQSITDVRAEETIGARSFMYPIHTDKSNDNYATENFSFVYAKRFGHRPSAAITLRNVEVKVIPEVIRDMSFLAIPGWPFLPTSAFAPPYEYLGRHMNVCFSNSQVLLCADEFVGDGRGLVLTGQFLARLEWMRKTGAKVVSLQISGLQVALERNLEQAALKSASGEITATRYTSRDSLILYPSDSLIDYVAAGVDEIGPRVQVEAESILCRINVKDTPILFAVLRRLGRLKMSYLVVRSFKQPGFKEQMHGTEKRPSADDFQATPDDPSSGTIPITYSTPAARILLTDESDERFVPILELNFESILMQGNVPHLVQVGMQISLNLFSRKKGWWEPGVEPWQVQANLSRGVSGSKSFVIKSDARLNLNVTPDTIQAAREVAASLRSVKDRADQFRARSHTSDKNEKSSSSTPVEPQAGRNASSSGPSVAAFHVRNELGLQVEVYVPATAQKSSILNARELEIHMPVEKLLTSNRSSLRGNERDLRREALKCNVSLPGFSALELSAAEVGIHELVFLPVQQSIDANNGELDRPIYAVWEISMSHGVPICTIRSSVQVLNHTDTVIGLGLCGRLSPEGAQQQLPSLLDVEDEGNIVLLKPRERFSIPIAGIERSIRIRPTLELSAPEEDDEFQATFDWSRPINTWAWLKSSHSLQTRSASKQRLSSGSKLGTPRFLRDVQLDHEVVRCKSLHTGSDFFVAAVPELFSGGFNAKDPQGCRLNVILQAPLTFSNKLPGRISYRISKAQGVDRMSDWGDANTIILGAGVMNPLDCAYVHCTDDTQNLSGISIAFENTPVQDSEGGLRRVNDDDDDDVPKKFGPFVALSSILSGQLKVLQAENSPAGSQRVECGGAVHVSSLDSRVPKFELFSPFWLRNRSDTNLEICSRSSFYGKTSNAVAVKGHPQGQLAGRFLCFDGPYVSLREEAQGANVSAPRQDWWTCPSDLRDISSAVSISIPNRSLLLDVRQTQGYSDSTFSVTIRNAAFVVNNSDRCIQWCQSSVLDSHGNCPFRFVHFLNPHEEAPIHWNGNSGRQSIHIRLAEENGSSDWIWSPPLPLLLGNAGEVSAKMYRPKSQEQYIARVMSAKLNGGASALVVLSEDRQNPPYRIVNKCKHRSIVFNQLGSKERPWLVRPGRSTRYSWDDPLVPSQRRRLEVNVIENQNDPWSGGSAAVLSARGSDPGSSARPAGSPAVHASRSASKSSSSRMAGSVLQVNIDIVNNTPREVREGLNLDLWYYVCVEGATKAVTFQDSDESTRAGDEESSRVSMPSSSHVDEDHSVPVVMWDDLPFRSAPQREQQNTPATSSLMQNRESRAPAISDYPKRDKAASSARQTSAMSMNIDAAFYLASAGVSFVNLEPAELLYAHVSNLHMNFESYESLECFSFHVTELQVDNQLDNPPFPVTLSALPGKSTPYQIWVDLKRVVTDSGILMLKSFRALVSPCNLMVDEDLIGRLLMFLNEVSSISYGPKSEILRGQDGEHRNILAQIGNKRKMVTSLRPGAGEASKCAAELKSSQRIYVEDLKLYGTKFVFSSSVARGSVAFRTLSLSPALRPFIAFLMNVENCEFDFSALDLSHVFDSRTHFVSLIRQYYETQLGNQKMKLLASNSLVGNPAALFESVSIGAKDLVSEPGRGRGGGDFLYGVGRGSKSLITHTVGGIVGSISSIPKAMSTGLESAVGDETYIAERERIRGSQLSGGRRMTSSNTAQGAVTGFLSFAHGISSGVAGLVKDPVQGAREGGASGFLKGMRKGLVGGVVKPVAGAIDLIAEPAAVISKQMNDADVQRRNGGPLAPKRPPRTFFGDSKRLVSFDMKAATGEELYKAVQITSGATHAARLVDWIELSDRKERSDPDAAEWVWSIVRQRTRSMGKSRRASKPAGSFSAPPAIEFHATQLRPEKTRIALLTEDHVLVATLECKLLLTIPLWEDATFSLESQGKDLFVVTTMGREATGQGGLAILAETQSFFAAPWDASTASRRRKPNPGQIVRDRIPCGSVAAREDLSFAVQKIFESRRKRRPDYEGRSFVRKQPSELELPVLPSSMDDGVSMELSSTRRSDAADGTADAFVLPMRSPGGDVHSAVIEEQLQESSTGAVVEQRSRSQLDSSIRRLSMGGTNRALDAKRSVRIIVTNEIEPAQQLELVRSSLERGYWRLPVPQVINSFEAVLFEVDSGSGEEMRRAQQRKAKEVHGSVLFRVAGPSDQLVSTSPQALLEFVNPSSGNPNYATRATGGLAASYERGNGVHATVIFRVSKGASSNTNLSQRIPQWHNPSMFGHSSDGPSSASTKSLGSSTPSRSVQEGNPAEARPPSASRPVDDSLLAQLLEYGFEAEAAAKALKQANGDFVKAIDLLT